MNQSRLTELPHSVLIFPIMIGGLVWVHHPTRGWEVPGGKLEHGESPEEAARREAFEEAGLTLGKLNWVAEYQFDTSHHRQSVRKWVYLADVLDIAARPQASEIMDVCIFRPVVEPIDARHRQDISPIMKDTMYEDIWPFVKDVLEAGSGVSACL
ncbi:NUDIX domain-containing protein [Alicyclobacillus dauci]|uniref:NUDIX domain-containing protein n=2 Tax=Alicyclobacillus dauci TaxID=1475485 RepID=A0ABY6Z8U9_9BACL|nr:NUDIX domain-containing protein [Alicyclobacillus dauci]